MTHRKNESKGYACGETPVNWKSSGKRELERGGGYGVGEPIPEAGSVSETGAGVADCTPPLKGRSRSE